MSAHSRLAHTTIRIARATLDELNRARVELDRAADGSRRHSYDDVVRALIARAADPSPPRA